MTKSRRIRKPVSQQEAIVPATLTPVPAEFTAPSGPAITPKQMEWILKCRDEKDLTPEHIEWINAEIAKGITKARASEILDRLFKLPRKRAAEVVDRISAANPFKVKAEDGTDVPKNAWRVSDLHTMGLAKLAEGRYALRDDSDKLNPIKFYRVTKWQGEREMMVSVKIMASDAEYPLKDVLRRYEVTKAICADMVRAAQLYGREIGSCGRCGRTLTRRLSREFGIGPDCAEQMGISGLMAGLKVDLIAAGIDPDEKVN